MTKTLATMIATAALVAATAAPAIAAPADGDPTTGPGTTLGGIQKAGAAATAKRIASLEKAITRVQANDNVTEADRTAILATLNADLDAMHRLAGEIAGDTTVPSAAEDYHSIFTDYRVYAVALPQALYAAGADALTGTAIPKLQSAYDRLEQKVGDDPTDAQQALLDEMAADIQDAVDGSHGLAAAALAVTPADWNADHDVLKDVRAELKDAGKAARDAARTGRALAKTL